MDNNNEQRIDEISKKPPSGNNISHEGRKSFSREIPSNDSGDHEIDEDKIAYPPLTSKLSPELMIQAKEDDSNRLPIPYWALSYIEWICTFIGGVFFIWGSYLFLPSLPPSTKSTATILFILGSALFCCASTAMYYRLGAYLWKDSGLSVNSCMYIFANVQFVIGSVFFYPGLPAPFEIAGCWLFIIGSLIFLFAPLYDIFRARSSFQAEQVKTTKKQETLSAVLNGLRHEAVEVQKASLQIDDNSSVDDISVANTIESIRSQRDETKTKIENVRNEAEVNFITFLCTSAVCGLYILGSLLFVIGSIMFLPQFYSRDSVAAVNIFIAGSTFFFAATLVTTFVRYALKMLRYLCCRKPQHSTRDSVFDRNSENPTRSSVSEV